MRFQYLSQQKAADNSEINLTPMLDVVFIMLIFFIVTATFIKQPGIEVEKPDAKSGQEKSAVGILVAIDASSHFWIDKKKVPRGAVRASIEKLHAENPKGSLVIQADHLAKYEALEMVIKDAKAVGLVDIAIATEPVN